jgi:hypothetical protein
VLHCTTKFCDYGKAAGAEEYAQQEVSPPPQGRPGGGGEGKWVGEVWPPVFGVVCNLVILS